MEEIWKFLTYAAVIMFGLPFLLFLGIAIMMFKELMDEDDSLRIVIRIGTVMMVVGLLIIVTQIII